MDCEAKFSKRTHLSSSTQFITLLPDPFFDLPTSVKIKWNVLKSKRLKWGDMIGLLNMATVHLKLGKHCKNLRVKNCPPKIIIHSKRFPNFSHSLCCQLPPTRNNQQATLSSFSNLTFKIIFHRACFLLLTSFEVSEAIWKTINSTAFALVQ